MSDRTTNIDPASEQTPLGGTGPLMGALTRFTRFLGSVRAWAYGHWIRSVIVAGTMLTLIALTMAGWAYLASVALHSGQVSLESSLKALDEGRYEEARAAVGRMLKSGRLPRNEYGGPLFVLGTIKTNDAENQPTPERRRVEYLVASRYLKEARAHGIPKERTADGLFLLGKSLVESGQFGEGVQTLDELLASEHPDGHPHALAAQRLLAETCLWMPDPKVDKALHHNESLLTSPSITDDERTNALMRRSECLARLGRFDEARQCVAEVPTGDAPRADVELLRGKILLDELTATFQTMPARDRKIAIGESAATIADAMQHLQQAESLDAQQSYVTRQSSYQLGRCLELRGDTEAALKQFMRTRQLNADSFEGLAAALAEADLLRAKGDLDGAVLGYRRVLESFSDVAIYHSYVLPREQVRERLMAALKDFVDRRRYAEALTLLEHFSPLFSLTEQLELQGGTLEQWGNQLVSQAVDDDSQRSAGLHHLRAAGVAFEQLAELRFATKYYTADLWHSAENFFQGHSFTRSIRLLNEYLDNEPELRNAEALLRLGQAYLALRRVPPSVAAFEECIEFHPFDSSTYQARIDCAKACWHQGNTSRAEQLLRDNIAGSTLKPSSREWKDSLFELGMLLHETGQYEEAIGTLEEAVERYPDDSQRLVAQYIIGESYRRWAQELLQRAQQVRTGSERGKTLQLATDRLNTALNHFEQVQVSITLQTHDIHSDPLLGTMLRNCYMLEGTVLFDLERYKEAIEAYSNVASLYPDKPFVLETFVQIANCWRRLGQDVKARGAIQQAQIALDGLPIDSDFASTTAHNREEWRMLLADMSKW